MFCFFMMHIDKGDLIRSPDGMIYSAEEENNKK